MQAAAERIESRERYVSRKQRTSLRHEEDLSDGNPDAEVDQDDAFVEDEEEDIEGENNSEEEVEGSEKLVLSKQETEDEDTEDSNEDEDEDEEGAEPEVGSGGKGAATVDAEEGDVAAPARKGMRAVAQSESKRVAFLERELDVLDGQLVRMQEDLDAAQEVLIKSQELAASREQALKEEVKDIGKI